MHVLPGGAIETLDAKPEEPGVFKGALIAAEAGSYRLWLEDPDAPDAGPRSPRIITASVPSAENDDPLLDEPLLRGLAAQTGGRYARLADAPELLDSLRDPSRERAVDEPEREELWANWLPLLLLVGLLSAAWAVRKRANLVCGGAQRRRPAAVGRAARRRTWPAVAEGARVRSARFATS